MTEAVMEALDRTEPDYGWIKENLERLRDEFAGQYVAVKDGEVVANAESSEDLHRQLEEKGTDVSRVAVRFIRGEGEYVIR